MNEANLGFNRFCGPAALSVITGLDTDRCAYAISQVNGQHKIKGVTVNDLILAGKKLGVESEFISLAAGRSIYFAASFILVKNPGMYIVATKTHYVVIESKDEKLSLCDNHTKTPIALENSARLSQKIETLIKVKYTETPIPKEVSREFIVDRIGSTVRIHRVVRMSDSTERNTNIASLYDLTSAELRKIAEEIIKNA